jgi:ClpP class serine protease
LITYFAAPVAKADAFINDDDPVYIEDMLRIPSQYSGLDLILNSNGGSAISAERIINVCQNYVQKHNNGEFRVIVPRVAKSAATIVALGADKIILCENAELGPFDPQIIMKDTKGNFFLKPGFLIINAVKQLTDNSNSIISSKNQRFLMFLNQYNYDIYMNAQNELNLSEDIANKILERKKCKYKELAKEEFSIFTDPTKTLSHGRLISISDLKNNTKLCSMGFIFDINEYFLEKGEQKLSKHEINRVTDLIWELYIRKNMLLIDSANPQIKIIEDSNWSFIFSDPKWKNPQTQQQIP